ncbi:MAG: glycosyltransferase [Planctomycetota bacterium]
MMNIRVAYLTGQYPRPTDTFIQREVAALRRRGVHVQTFSIRRISNDSCIAEEQAEERKRTIYVLPPQPASLLRDHAILFFRSPMAYLSTLWLALTVRSPGIKSFFYQVFYFIEAVVVAREVQRQDIIHIHNHFANSSCTVAMLAAKLGGVTFSFTTHGPAIFFEPKLWCVDEKIKRSLFVSCISYFCRSQLMIWASLDHWSKLHIVHCGVDPALFEVVTPRPDRANLMYVGRLDLVKGLPVLLRSIAQLKDTQPHIRLRVVGDGPDRERLENLSSQLALDENVEFVGFQSQAEVRKHLQNTDIFVMSSFAEGVPVVLMEAMAAGLPVVATRIAGIAELVDEGLSGFLVPPGQVGQLSMRLDQLIGDAELRAKFGRWGRAKIEAEFDINKEGAWLAEVLTRALEGRPVGARPGEEATSADSGRVSAATPRKAGE